MHSWRLPEKYTTDSRAWSSGNVYCDLEVFWTRGFDLFPRRCDEKAGEELQQPSWNWWRTFQEDVHTLLQPNGKIEVAGTVRKKLCNDGSRVYIFSLRKESVQFIRNYTEQNGEHFENERKQIWSHRFDCVASSFNRGIMWNGTWVYRSFE